jgi:hypothetical protein
MFVPVRHYHVNEYKGFSYASIPVVTTLRQQLTPTRFILLYEYITLQALLFPQNLNYMEGLMRHVFLTVVVMMMMMMMSIVLGYDAIWTYR